MQGSVLRILATLLSTCLLLRQVSEAARLRDDERLIGWRGEVPQFEYNERELPKQPAVKNTTSKRPWIQAISWKPRAFVYHNFLSDAESRHIVELAHKQMKRSTVVGSDKGGVVDDVRTSYGTFLRRNQDPVIKAIEERLAMWSHLPASHQEDMQVLRYGPTNKYGPHIDGLQRVMSVLMYIVEPEFGGETAFPNSQWANPELAALHAAANVSECAKNRVHYKPKRGDALMFYDMKPDYTTQDGDSMHTGCPVITGVKWNAVKWIHGKPFRPEEYEKALTEPYKPLPDPGMCINLDERCEDWATAGECKKNPGYMVGAGNGFGSCRKACKDCEDCKEGDDSCYQRNREKGGFLVLNQAELDVLNGN